MINAQNIYKSYEGLEVLKGVSLNIKKGEIVSIIGASGAGKSTLLQILGTLTKSDKGSIQINNQTIQNLNSKDLSKFRNQEIGFIFQEHQLLPEFSALENVCLPYWIQQGSKKDAEIRAKEILSELGLADRLNHKPMELSGGEQQRVAVARALINEPQIILADEPTGSLDFETAKITFEILKKQINSKRLIIFATHNRFFANKSDCLLEIVNGNIKTING